MGANTIPIFSRVADIQGKVLTTGAMTPANMLDPYADTNVTNNQVFVSDASNGGYVQKLRFKLANPSVTTATAASTARIYINDGTSSAGHTWYYGDVTLPAVQVNIAAATSDIEYPMNIALPAGYKIWIGQGTAPGNSNQWICTTIAGKY